jgi:cytochrome c2
VQKVVRLRVPAFLVTSCVMTAAPSCTSAPDTPRIQQAASPRPAQYDTNTITLVLPVGDAHAGRQAFIDLKCMVCHRVAGDTTLPAPVGAAQGPDLDRTLRGRPVAEVASAIIVPSHSTSVRVSDDVKKQLEAMSLSPMGDFTRTITVRQLADLLAYLTSRDQVK